MSEISTKPYLIRAIYEWCADNGYTPYISVVVDETTRVPMEYVRNGEIVLNIGSDAAHRLTMKNHGIEFAARFGGVSQEISVPIAAVSAIYARENGRGMSFELLPVTPGGPIALVDAAAPGEDSGGNNPRDPEPPSGKGKPKPSLRVVK